MVNPMDDSQYLADIAKISKKCQRLVERHCPEVGVFWVDLEGRNIPFSFSEPLGMLKPKQGIDYLTCARRHSTEWRFLKRNRLLPGKWSANKYKELPRGRVFYDRKRKRYMVYANIEITEIPWLKEAVIKDFNLQNRKIDFIDFPHCRDLRIK